MIQEEPSPEAPGPTRPFRDFLRYFLWLGSFGFGSPIASVGYCSETWSSGADGSTGGSS